MAGLLRFADSPGKYCHGQAAIPNYEFFEFLKV